MTTQPHRFTACNRHPDGPVNGFCPSCLRERLAGLDPSGHLNTFSGGGADVASSSLSVLAPEIRRSKSFSGDKCNGVAGFYEPRRRSCDVRARSTLWSLFNVEDQRHVNEVETKNLGFSRFELREEDENEEEDEEIRVCEDVSAPNVNADAVVIDSELRFDDVEDVEEVRTMKEHIDLEWNNRKQSGRDLKDIAGSFWIAASVFSKKLRKWRRTQKKMKKLSSNGGAGIGDERRNEIRCRETQSEIADYGFGRRSCDTDPRFSVDAGRMSLDDAKCSFDEPRASWDGYLIGRSLPRLVIPPRKLDNQIPIEESKENPIDENQIASSSSSRIQKDNFDNLRSNARVSPENVEFFHGTKRMLFTGRDLNCDSLKNECNGGFVSTPVKGLKKNHNWRNAWNIWGLIHRRGDRKCENEEEGFKANVGESTSTESETNGESNVGYARKLSRSNSSVGSRNSSKGNGTKRREEFMIERKRGVRYSPNNLDNGLLRFYLTPLRTSRRSKPGKSRLKNSHSIVLN